MFKVLQGDCLEVLRDMPDCSVDSIVTDPPYELGFMGKAWDNQGIAYNVELWQEALRVLKPGGHLLAFGGTRTWHRLAVAIEDAGFEVRDSLAWIYGSGFPKSKNVALAIDKGEGHPNRGKAIPTASTYQATDVEQKNKLTSNPVPDYEAKSEKAKAWEGWGTALKPAFEPIVMARKPLSGTVAATVLEWGTGAINIDGSRIRMTENDAASSANNWKPNGYKTTENIFNLGQKVLVSQQSSAGRWPANVLLDEDTAQLLDEQSGISKSPAGIFVRKAGSEFGQSAGWNAHENKDTLRTGHGDSGGASRFFYVAKAPKKERPTTDGITHPTVKPLTLMRYLVKLVTPPGGTTLDPFAGSGTTIEAAHLEGFDVIGIERETDYIKLINTRMDGYLA